MASVALAVVVAAVVAAAGVGLAYLATPAPPARFGVGRWETVTPLRLAWTVGGCVVAGLGVVAGLVRRLPWRVVAAPVVMAATLAAAPTVGVDCEPEPLEAALLPFPAALDVEEDLTASGIGPHALDPAPGTGESHWYKVVDPSVPAAAEDGVLTTHLRSRGWHLRPAETPNGHHGLVGRAGEHSLAVVQEDDGRATVVYFVRQDGLLCVPW